MSLSPNFPKTGILLSQNSPNSGIFMGSYFLSLYVPNFRDFIVSDLLQRWDLAGFKLTITQIFPSGTTGRNDVKCMWSTCEIFIWFFTYNFTHLWKIMWNHHVKTMWNDVLLFTSSNAVKKICEIVWNVCCEITHDRSCEFNMWNIQKHPQKMKIMEKSMWNI